MSNNTLSKIAGAVVAGWWDQFFTALTNDFVGRNTSGEPEAGKKCGTSSIPWGEVHASNLYLGGTLLDPSNLGGSGNGIVSGATRTDSEMPDFIRANGAAASFSVLGAATALSLNINGTGVTVASDLTLGSLNTAPSTNNTATIDDGDLTGDEQSKYAGEREDTITLDNVGSEITDRVGQVVALKHGTSEIMFARILEADGGAGTATLDNVYRGYFFDSSGDPIPREAINDNDTLTLYNLAWVFLQTDGTTIDVTYTTPKWSHTEPASPAADDYWFDLSTGVWMRYDGSDWEDINRTHIGWVVMDGANCIASRCVDFSKGFSDFIAIETDTITDTTVQSEGTNDALSVYGNIISYGNSPVIWDIATNLETGLTEANETYYFLYITENGTPVISEERPYNRTHDLRGWYHPYHSWRFVGACYNDASGNIIVADSHNTSRKKEEFFTNTTPLVLLPNAHYKVTLVGGGGGGGGWSSSTPIGGNSGGDTSLGTLMSANGGTAGGGSGGDGGTGGTGDLKFSGGSAPGDAGDNDIQSFGGASLFSNPRLYRSNTAGNGVSGLNYGGGGTGARRSTVSAPFYAGAGGGGETVFSIVKAQSAYAPVTIGAGGSGGNGAAYNGGAGASGLAILEYL